MEQIKCQDLDELSDKAEGYVYDNYEKEFIVEEGVLPDGRTYAIVNPYSQCV